MPSRHRCGDYPHQGSGSDHDSVGLFQQRPSQGWGSVGQLMDPGYAATTFLRSLVQVPGWQRQPLWQAAQAVQRSADSAAYAQWAALGTAVAGALWDHTGGALSCTSGAVGAVGAIGAQGCSVVPDPSTGTGCLTPRMAALYTELVTGGLAPVLLPAQRPRRAQRPPPGQGLRRTARRLWEAPDRGPEGRRGCPRRLLAGHRRPHRRALSDLVRPDLERRPRPRRLAALPRCRCLQHHPDHPGRHHRRPLRPRPHLGLLKTRHPRWTSSLGTGGAFFGSYVVAYGAADEGDDD